MISAPPLVVTVEVRRLVFWFTTEEMASTTVLSVPPTAPVPKFRMAPCPAGDAPLEHPARAAAHTVRAVRQEIAFFIVLQLLLLDWLSGLLINRPELLARSA